MKDTLFNIIIPVFISAITGYASSKFAYNKEIKRKIYDEREKTYIDLFDLVEKLKRNPSLIYNSAEFLTPFREIRARLNLYSSQNVLDIVTPLNNRIDDIFKKYSEMYDSPEAHTRNETRLKYDDLTELEFYQEEERYKEENVIDEEYVNGVFLSLISQIRKELKT